MDNFPVLSKVYFSNEIEKELKKNIPFSTQTFLILLMFAFFYKNQRLLAKTAASIKAMVWELY